MVVAVRLKRENPVNPGTRCETEKSRKEYHMGRSIFARFVLWRLQGNAAQRDNIEDKLDAQYPRDLFAKILHFYGHRYYAQRNNMGHETPHAQTPVSPIRGLSPGMTQRFCYIIRREKKRITLKRSGTTHCTPEVAGR